MDVYRKDIQRAVKYLNNQNMSAAKNVASGLVENVKVWRQIQISLSQLLNGLITELENALNRNDDQAVESIVRTIFERYEGLRLALETELQKSRI
jgi:hypothetical protein